MNARDDRLNRWVDTTEPAASADDPLAPSHWRCSEYRTPRLRISLHRHILFPDALFLSCDGIDGITRLSLAYSCTPEDVEAAKPVALAFVRERLQSLLAELPEAT